MPWKPPTLESHVPSFKRGMALAAAALSTMQSNNTEYDRALAELRSHLPHGPALPGTCHMCHAAHAAPSNTCHDCNKLLRKELYLLKKKHGTPPADNKCEVCKHVSPKTLSLDHHHGRGHARAWVCTRCNAGLSLFDRNPGRFMAFVSQF